MSNTVASASSATLTPASSGKVTEPVEVTNLNIKQRFPSGHKLKKILLMNTEKQKEITVVIAEDDDGHAELIREALFESGINNPIIRFSNGQETWDYFNEKTKHGNLQAVEAFLLLLDINMPMMDGIEVLKRIKANSMLKGIPVIMLTTTDDPREIEQCYKIGCNVYITKPVDFLKFTETLKRLGLFMQIIKL